MKRIVLTILSVLQLLFVVEPGYAENHPTSLTVGSKTFTESVILGEVIRQLLIYHGASTVYKAQLGGTRILWNALLAGEIDVYTEYSGTLIHELLVKEKLTSLEEVRQSLLNKGIGMTKPLGFNNTYAIGIKEKLAQRLNIKTISDLRRYPELKLGFTNEFMERQDGWPGLQKKYQLQHKNVTGLEHNLAYRGIESNALQIIDLYSTDAEINYYQLRILEDDLRYFPAYQAVIIYRDKLKHEYPKIITALHQLTGTLDAFSMIGLNADVKLHGKSESQVAKLFLNKIFNITVNSITETRWQQFLRYSKEHFILVFISLFSAILTAIPLGIMASKVPRFRHVIIGTASIIQTIPTLALFVFMIPLLGIGGPPAVIALFLYSLLPIIRNTYAGLNDIPIGIIESAEVLGLSAVARLRLIELPLATRSILAGIKTSAVINVGTATLGALIGAGGYGQPILTGIRLDDTNLILLGAIPAAVLALIVQGFFELLERNLLSRKLTGVTLQE